MDPLSAASAIAGLLALAGSTAEKLESFIGDLKSRPALLLAINRETSALLLILGQLEGRVQASNDNHKDADDKGLLAILEGCMGLFREIGVRVSELRSTLENGTRTKVFAALMYPSRMKELSALRADLERYKATLSIALHLHQP